MKLASVELCGFRGFKHRTKFEFPSGFAVLTGRNGVGKSTVLDAVEFVLTGTISKFAVTGAKGGGLGEHIWWVGEGSLDAQFVTVRFVDDEGQLVEITRSRDKGIQGRLQDVAAALCEPGAMTVEGWAETLIRTTLIRDETLAALSLDLPEQARASAVRSAIGSLGGPDYSKRTSAISQAAVTEKSQQEARMKRAQADLGRVLSALTEARSIAQSQPDLAEANKILDGVITKIPLNVAQRAEAARQRLASEKQTIERLHEALARAAELDAERQFWDSAFAKSELASASTELATARNAQESAGLALKAALDAEAASRSSDDLVNHLVALLEHGEIVGLQDGHCPLCDAARSNSEFAAGLEAARHRLTTRGRDLAKLRTAVEKARGQLRDAETMRLRAEERLSALEARKTRYLTAIEANDEIFRRADMPATSLDLSAATTLVAHRMEDMLRIEHALYLLDASTAQDRVASLEIQVERLRALIEEGAARMAAAERAVEAARQIENSVKAVANELSQEQFDIVLPLLKELYRRLRPHVTWREIDTDFGGRVRASLNLTVGDGRNPQFLFSSGQRRAAGIAFLLAIHLSRSWCRLNTVLLDDPVQHVDDYRALNLVEVLSAIRRSGRQVVIAVEDPALADLLCRRLRSTATEQGKRFDLCMSTDGSATVEKAREILPLPRETLRAVS